MMTREVSVPDRPLFKPAEVSTIAGLQPFVLRSWEAEFPSLGSANGKSGVRVYSRADVQLVLKIKELVYGEGLTLGAARRKLMAAEAPESSEESSFAEFLNNETRQQLTKVKQGLHDILGLLGEPGAATMRQESLLRQAVPDSKAKPSVRSGKKVRKPAKTSGAKTRKGNGAPRARA